MPAMALPAAMPPSTPSASWRAAATRSPGKRRELDAVILGKHRQRLGVEPHHLGEHVVRLRGTGMRDNRLVLVAERVPHLERDDALAGAVRLVEAWIVAARCDVIEAERYIGAVADEFGAVEHARWQRCEDFRRRRGLRRAPYRR